MATTGTARLGGVRARCSASPLRYRANVRLSDYHLQSRIPGSSIWSLFGALIICFARFRF